MNRGDWWYLADSNKEALKNLISHYHPAAPDAGKQSSLPITAPRVEAVLGPIRQDIKLSTVLNPVEEFDKALAEYAIPTLHRLLEETWFGVPESTDCWSLKGYPEVVDLLDDPPESSPAQT